MSYVLETLGIDVMLHIVNAKLHFHLTLIMKKTYKKGLEHVTDLALGTLE